MAFPDPFRQKLARGEICLGTAVTFSDATVTECLGDLLDFVWIDTEHNPLSLERVQAHLMAVKGSATFPLVRVPWNDPVLIKPVLDIGAAGVIVPLIRTADDARQAVAACRYPPAGVRGFGPRRANGFGRESSPEYCARADAEIMINVQIEHADAVQNLDRILDCEGLSGIVIGPNDLAGSLGRTGHPEHPEVQQAIDVTIEKARAAAKFVGIGSGVSQAEIVNWAQRGVQWITMGADFALLRKVAADTVSTVRAALAAGHS
jgi:2-keto-3-deoxy-L-rhamnonate aldolase RhmA